MNTRDDLIQNLSDELKPVKPIRSVLAVALCWLLASCAYTVAITAYFGPIRPEALQQLLTVPRFLVENLCGFLGIALIVIAGFRSAVPGRASQMLLKMGLTLMGFWLLLLIYGLWDPALAPTMSGKREDCWIETMAFSLPPIAVALLIARRLLPLRPVATTLMLCMAAGALPALYMQLACMYVVPHIFTHHVLPGFIAGFVLALLSLLYHHLFKSKS